MKQKKSGKNTSKVLLIAKNVSGEFIDGPFLAMQKWAQNECGNFSANEGVNFMCTTEKHALEIAAWKQTNDANDAPNR